MSVTGHWNEQSLKSYVREPSLRQRDQMCQILTNYGKSEEPDMQLQLHKEMNETQSARRSIMLTNRKDSLEISNKSAIFAGANFNGQTTINLQINQQ